MAKLTPTQQQFLENVAVADQAWRTAKIETHKKYRLLAEAEIADYATQRDNAVRKAFAEGVPKTRIGEEGLHTRAPSTVEQSLERTERVSAVITENLLPQDVLRYSLSTVEGLPNPLLTVTMLGRDFDEYVSTIRSRFRRRALRENITTGEYWVNPHTLTVGPRDRDDTGSALAIDSPVTAWLLHGPGAAEVREYLEENLPAFLDVAA